MSSWNHKLEVHQYHEPKPLSHLLWSSYFQGHCFYSAVVSLSICQHIMKRSLLMDRKAQIARQSRQSQQWQLLFRPLLLSAVPIMYLPPTQTAVLQTRRRLQHWFATQLTELCVPSAFHILTKHCTMVTMAPLQHLKRKWRWNPLTFRRCSSV